MKRLICSLSISLALIGVGCSKKVPPKEKKPVPVQVTRAITKNVPKYISTVGHMEAIQTIDIMAQADGYLLKTYFSDGADVKQGDLLYLIDQRPYIAALEKAEGELEENIASLGFAERTAERNSQLVKDEYISQNDYDNLITNVLVDDSLVKQSRSAVETAKINLGYTTIYSPIDARAGISQVRDGNLVLESAETTLVTLNQIAPIYNSFFINEKDLPAVQRCKEKNHDLKVLATVDDPKTPSYEGVLTFIDNTIDLATGMIELRATHANEDRVLWPNQYVKVKLILETIENAILIPIEAVQISPKGKFVYVVKGGGTVDMKIIETGQPQDNNMIVIEKGLKAGEKVVTVGQLNLYPGAKVVVKKNEEDE